MFYDWVWDGWGRHSKMFYRLFDFMNNSHFDVASDAFATLKELLTRHKAVTAKFLEDNFDEVPRRPPLRRPHWLCTHMYMPKQ